MEIYWILAETMGLDEAFLDMIKAIYTWNLFKYENFLLSERHFLKNKVFKTFTGRSYL